MSGRVWELLGVRKESLEETARGGADVVNPILRIRLRERLMALAGMRRAGGASSSWGTGSGAGAREDARGAQAGSRYLAEFRFSPREKPRAESRTARQA